MSVTALTINLRSFKCCLLMDLRATAEPMIDLCRTERKNANGSQIGWYSNFCRKQKYQIHRLVNPFPIRCYRSEWTKEIISASLLSRFGNNSIKNPMQKKKKNNIILVLHLRRSLDRITQHPKCIARNRCRTLATTTRNQ